jgi:outer membrane lipoprotein carrier protein
MDSEKCWRRRLRSLISGALLASVVAVPFASAQTEPGSAAAGLATLEAFLDGVQSLQADFKQEIWTAEQRLERKDAGTLVLKRPNRFRWTYADPTELIVVANGSKLWIYDVEIEEVTVTPFDDEVAVSPAMLLSGDGGVREQFEVVDTFSADGLEWIKLEPLARGSDFTSIQIGFDGTAPRRLELVDGLNHVTRIELDNLVVNPEIADTVFELEVPPGVHVTGEG